MLSEISHSHNDKYHTFSFEEVRERKKKQDHENGGRAWCYTVVIPVTQKEEVGILRFEASLDRA
jgi:hypothetical protein